MWFDLIDATDAIFLANLRGQGLSPAKVEAEYRACYARQVEEQDRTVRHMLTEFDRRWTNMAGELLLSPEAQGKIAIDQRCCPKTIRRGVSRRIF